MASLLVAGAGGQVPDLRTGVAAHAFDHLGSIGGQAETAAACGATIIYTSGVGARGYQGLPEAETLLREEKETGDYIRNAKRKGIRLAMGYVCATSMVNLERFDKNWTAEFRARFHSSAAAWRQQDRKGNPLPSWYGGKYEAACMSNPDWREYERFMVREQLEAGCDGIFFDNPTMHPRGCYCPWCMRAFARFLEEELAGAPGVAREAVPNRTEALRDWADKHAVEFLAFRGTIARDFLAEMRRYARTINREALITANNSLNSPDVFYSQCRTHGYNIYEMSRAEDFVVVEDMNSQARTAAGGRVFEYTPVYRMLHAISHGKPVVAATLAESDYHTPPDLARLGLAEAAANGASSLFWPTWPEEERERMTKLIRPEVDFLRENAELFWDSRPREDALLVVLFRDWMKSDRCRALEVAKELTRADVAYGTICEDELLTGLEPEELPGEMTSHKPIPLPKRLHDSKVLIVPPGAVFTAKELGTLERFMESGGRIISADKPEWPTLLRAAIGIPSVVVGGPNTVRAIVRDEGRRTIVNLLNLHVERVNSFEDNVKPATDLRVRIRVPLRKLHAVRALTADEGASSGALWFRAVSDGAGSLVEVAVPRVWISTVLVVE